MDLSDQWRPTLFRRRKSKERDSFITEFFCLREIHRAISQEGQKDRIHDEGSSLKSLSRGSPPFFLNTRENSDIIIDSFHMRAREGPPSPSCWVEFTAR